MEIPNLPPVQPLPPVVATQNGQPVIGGTDSPSLTILSNSGLPASGSASQLTGTQAATQNNTNQSVANIRNTAIYNQNISGSSISVGDIKIETPSLEVSTNYNPQYGDLNINAQLVVPLGQGGMRKSVRKIIRQREMVALGQLAVSVKNHCLNMEQISALYPDMPQLLVFAIDRPTVSAAERRACHRELPEPTPQAEMENKEAEIERLKMEIAQLKSREAAHKMRTTGTEQTEPIQGLW
jgi:hypothetical protein